MSQKTLSAGVKKKKKKWFSKWRKHVIPKKRNPLRLKTHIVLLSYLDCIICQLYLLYQKRPLVSFRASESREGRIQNYMCVVFL